MTTEALSQVPSHTCSTPEALILGLQTKAAQLPVRPREKPSARWRAIGEDTQCHSPANTLESLVDSAVCKYFDSSLKVSGEASVHGAKPALLYRANLALSLDTEVLGLGEMDLQTGLWAGP